MKIFINFNEHFPSLQVHNQSYMNYGPDFSEQFSAPIFQSYFKSIDLNLFGWFESLSCYILSEKVAIVIRLQKDIFL